jgi:hypothetical protein
MTLELAQEDYSIARLISLLKSAYKSPRKNFHFAKTHVIQYGGRAANYKAFAKIMSVSLHKP